MHLDRDLILIIAPEFRKLLPLWCASLARSPPRQGHRLLPSAVRVLSLLDIIRQQVVHFSVGAAPPASYLLWIHIFLQAGEKSGSKIDWRSQVCLSPMLRLNLHRHLVQWLLAAVLIIGLAFLASTARFVLRD